MEPCLAFLRRELTELSPTYDASLVSSCLNLFGMLIEQAMSGGTKLPRRGSVAVERDAERMVAEESLSAEQIAQRTELLESCFFFALLWSVGKSGDDASQRARKSKRLNSSHSCETRMPYTA